MSENYFASNLKYLRSKRGLEQKDISEMLGLKSSTSVTNWEKGSNMARSGHLNDLANYFGVQLHDLINTDLTSLEESTIDKLNKIVDLLDETRKFKVYRFASDQLSEQNNILEFPDLINEPYPKSIINGRKSAAGYAIDVDDYDAEVISESMVPHGADELVEIVGDSMEPLIQKGSDVYIRHQPSVENGEVAIIRIENEGVTCKRFYYNDESKTIILKSENEKYEDMFFDPSQVTVLGKVLI